MPELLKQAIILGYPNAGKTTFLKEKADSIFTPIKKEGTKINILFRKRTFEETLAYTKRNFWNI